MLYASAGAWVQIKKNQVLINAKTTKLKDSIEDVQLWSNFLSNCHKYWQSYVL